MNSVGYQQDPIELILTNLRQQQQLSVQLTPRHPHSYFQVQYQTKQIFKMNPEDAEHYQRTSEEQNAREYLQETRRDKLKIDALKQDLQKKFFKIRHLRPLNLKQYTLEEEPLSLLKSFSHTHHSLPRNSSLASSLKNSKTPTIKQSQNLQAPSTTRTDIKSHYAEQFQQLLDDSQKLGQRKSSYKLVGGTQKQKVNQEIMRQERKDILSIIKKRDYSQHRPQRLEEVTNKEKYNLRYLQYLKTKTKMGLDKAFFQKKIRKIDGRLQYFQQFILREGKMKEAARGQLQNFYIKMREEFRRIQKNHSPRKKESSFVQQYQ